MPSVVVPYTQEELRRHAWEIGESHRVDAYVPATAHVALAMVTPCEGFAHYRIPTPWVEETAPKKGHAWHNCRLVLRLYDVSNIHFNGLNAHSMQDVTLPSLCGQVFYKLPRPGTWQIGEIGFLLRNGEFVPAARSHATPFPPDSPSRRGDHTALLVNEKFTLEEIGNVWEQERILNERRRPRLRNPLRLAAFTFASPVSGQQGTLATFVSELAAGKAAAGHEVHVFAPASGSFASSTTVAGAHYHPLPVPDGSPLDRARAFARVAEERLRHMPGFDLVHLHEWMTGFVPRNGPCPVVLSLSSLETTRRNGTPVSPLSLAIEEAENAAAANADCILTPAWLRERATAALGVEGRRVRAFPMEGRLPNEWDYPLDFGDVKRAIGFGPLDRMLLFVGPLEHAAGPDLLLEALPTQLGRCSNLRLAFAGAGNMHGHLQGRAHQLGIAHAVRLLGHVERDWLVRLLRASEALVLPSRYRVPFDDAVVDLARRAGRPVVTTTGGPAYLVRHEENGIVTYDNPGSMVWAMDRILGDPGHAQRMGFNGRREEGSAPRWSEVADHYLDLCAGCFSELTEMML